MLIDLIGPKSNISLVEFSITRERDHRVSVFALDIFRVTLAMPNGGHRGPIYKK